MKKLAVALASALLVAGVPAAEAATPTAGGAGIGDPYFPTDGNGGYDVVHYDIHDSYRIDTHRLFGWTAVTARATKDLSSFHLDFLLSVDAVKVDGARAAFARPSRHELVVSPAEPIPAGTVFRVRVAYHGDPSATVWPRKHGLFADDHEVMATNEPHIAPWWFPANDHPRDKARFDITVKVPPGNKVIANGRLVKAVYGKRWTSWHWTARDPMATYLAFFAGGRFTVERGVDNGLPWTIAVSRRLPTREHRQSLELMRTTPRVVSWLASQLGHYPFEVTGGVTTSLSRNFALENQTRPTYDAWGGAGAIGVVVHEQAHQWFGDSVAIRSWSDIWLNEGFASFMGVRWDETHGDPAAQWWLQRTYRDFPADDEIWTVPPGAPGKAYIFSRSVYTRGAMTLQALRHRIGDADFWPLLRTWASQRRNGNGSVRDFTALAEQVSGEDLGGFFKAWLFTRAKPAATADNGLP